MVLIERCAWWASPHYLLPSQRHSINLSNRALTATEKNPGQDTRSRGLCRLLPQLVSSFDPGDGVSGDGVPPGSGLSISNLGHEASQRLGGGPRSLQHFAFLVCRKLAPTLCRTK